MGYTAGIDLGTTFSAVATADGTALQMVTLGATSATVPSALLLRDDHEVLTGDAAIRRGAAEPDRLAREFKRRMGDPAPLFLGGAPFSAQRLTALLLRWVVDRLVERMGAGPEAITITHPANWGAYKLDHLQQAVREADLGDIPIDFLSEPEAAAIHYAAQERIPTGTVVAVYDLGGGTFDAAVLRKTADGFEILGSPDGVEHLGGIDFDATMIELVDEGLGGVLADLDSTDPATVSALARLRDDCTTAKLGLSEDTDVSVPVYLPNNSTQVRVTRAEFEDRIKPSLQGSIDALRRALRSASVEAADVDRVVLVGGSSRIPLVGQLVSQAFGRPVAIDSDPKHATAMGAALHAASQVSVTGSPVVESSPVKPDVVDPGPAEPTPVAQGSALVASTTDAVPPQPPPAPGAFRAPEPSTKSNPLTAIGVVAAVVALTAGFLVLSARDAGDGESTSSTSTTSTTLADSDNGGTDIGSSFVFGTTPCADDDSPRQIDFESGFENCIRPGVVYTATFGTNRGTMVVELDTERTPGTTNNFVNLARHGYYDGTLIFRADGSLDILQGGSPHTQSNADPGPGFTITDEGGAFTEDGSTGPFTYEPGQLVMARTTAPNSASGQYFFTTGPDSSALDGQGTYVVFGTVLEGLDVLQEIQALEAPRSFGELSEEVVVDSVTIDES